MIDYVAGVFKGIGTVAIGMKATFMHLFTPANTLQYPREKATLPERSRSRLFMKYEDCIGCFQCDKACPVDCITIETVKAASDEDLGITSDGRAKKQWVLQFDIDMAKCCYCGLCVYPCPTECIYMTTEYEFSEQHRTNLVYHFTPFTPGTATKKRTELAEKKAAAAAEKAARAAQAKAAAQTESQSAAGTSPAGDKPPAPAPPSEGGSGAAPEPSNGANPGT